MKNAIRLAWFVLLLAVGAAPSRAVTASGTFVYVHDRGTVDQVFGFSLARDGTLDPLAGSPFAGPPASNSDCGGYCQTLSFSKKRKLLFSSHKLGLVSWNVAKDGALTLVQPAAVGGAKNFGVAVVQRGKRTFVYSGLFGSGEVAGYEAGADGFVVPLDASPFPAGTGALGARSFGNRLVISNQNDPSLSSYIVEKDGSLTEAPNSPASTGSEGSFNVDIDPRGRFVYNGNSGTGVSAFSMNPRTADLAPVGEGPLPTGLTDCSSGVAFSKKLAVVCESGSLVQVFHRERDGTLTALGDPQNPDLSGDISAHSFDRAGRLLVLATNLNVATLSVDPKTGILTPVDSVAISGASVNDLVLAKP